ncbi:hypothetical protein F5883DRAFT_171391 [Diaporthe sp. PMI_573]|nr:hypothetical protein F5883DRAFT_171391 [Diaporthaceae sp. PMI_573]
MDKLSSLGTFPLTSFGLLLLRAIDSQSQTRLCRAAHRLVNHVSNPRSSTCRAACHSRKWNGGGQHARRPGGRQHPIRGPRAPSLAKKKQSKQQPQKAGEATWRQAWMTASCLATASTCQSSSWAPLRARPSNARIAGFDCPLQMERSFRHRPGLYLERLYPLRQSWPDRKA